MVFGTFKWGLWPLSKFGISLQMSFIFGKQNEWGNRHVFAQKGVGRGVTYIDFELILLVVSELCSIIFNE